VPSGKVGRELCSGNTGFRDQALDLGARSGEPDVQRHREGGVCKLGLVVAIKARAGAVATEALGVARGEVLRAQMAHTVQSTLAAAGPRGMLHNPGLSACGRGGLERRHGELSQQEMREVVDLHLDVVTVSGAAKR